MSGPFLSPDAKRLVVAGLGALALHAALLVLARTLDVRTAPAPKRTALVMDVIDVKPPPVAPAPPPEPPPEPPEPEPPAPEVDERPRPEPKPDATPKPRPPKPRPPKPAPEVTEPEVTAPPEAPAPEAPPPPVAEAPSAPPGALPDVVPEGSGSPVRVPAGPPSMLDRVLGGGGHDPFGNNLADLEAALEYKADGPLTDKQRAERTARRMIEEDLADDAVSAGLADDYFRKLKEQIELSWRPAKKDLSDGGESASQLGFLRDSVDNAEALGEVWRAYLDVAQQFSRGQKATLERKRVERIRELMRSRKGGFRFHTICEVVITQAADGKVLTIEMPVTSGHPGIDDGLKEAIVRAVATMSEEPPGRLSLGRAFRSRWRMRATWTMVPPTAIFTGGSFDIGPNGLEVDVPFQIKLSKHVMLQSFDNRDHAIAPAR